MVDAPKAIRSIASIWLGLLAGAPSGQAQGLVFVPGLYEIESRSSASPDRGERRIECIRATDVEAFRRETIARFLQAPQFRAVCRLSESRPRADGFAFAMDCGEARAVNTFTFAEGLVRSVTRTQVRSRPEYSSELVTLSRRIDGCRGNGSDAVGGPQAAGTTRRYRY